MEAVIQGHSLPTHATADKALGAAARFWFAATLVGQWLFAYYILAFYGGTALHGQMAKWTKVLTAGWVPGDRLGNAAIAAHLLIAVIIMVGGPLQLVPQIRSRAPRVHRVIGRTYVLTAVVTSLTGIYMVFVRPTAGDLAQHVGTAVGGLMILFCAAMAFSYAVKRDFARHRQWALRLFMVVSGVWFFRIGLMFWLLLNHGPVGFDPDTFRGPFLTFLSFAEYLLPLAALEAYLRAKAHGSVGVRWLSAVGLAMLTLAMCVGIFGAFMAMWRPHL